MDDGFVYGNTRLRARKPELLGAADYAVLAGCDGDGLLAALAETAYRPDVQAALPRFRGRRALQEAIRGHVARQLGDLRRFYAGPARDQVDLLLGRVDLRNLRTVLRGLARFTPADEIVALLDPGGMVDDTVLSELAAQANLRAAVDLMVAWALPRRDVARAVLAAWPAYQRTGDPAVLEGALGRAWAERLAAEELPKGAEPLARLLRREIDLANVLVAGRLGRARERGEPLGDGGPEAFLLPGGTIDPALIGRAVAAPDRAASVAALAALPFPERWHAALSAFERHGDLLALTEALEALLIREAIGLFTTGDPLGVAVPIAFTAALENEARNLRLVGAAVEAGDPPELTLGRLVLVEP